MVGKLSSGSALNTRLVGQCHCVTLDAARTYNKECIKADGNALLHPKSLLIGEAHAHRLLPRGEPTTTNK